MSVERIEQIAAAVKERVVKELQAYDFDSTEIEYLADRIIAYALKPYVDEWVELRVTGTSDVKTH